MSPAARGSTSKKMPDSVRRAVERTIESTLGSGAQTRERAQDVVDEVLRRGASGAAKATRGVREVTDRQREAATGVGERLVAAIQDLRLATGEDVRELRARLDTLDRRIAKLEKGLGKAGKKGSGPKAAKKKKAGAKSKDASKSKKA